MSDLDTELGDLERRAAGSLISGGKIVSDEALKQAELLQEHAQSPEGGAVSGSDSLFRQGLRVYMKNKLAVASTLFILFTIGGSIGIPFIEAGNYWTLAPSGLIANSCYNQTNPGVLGNAGPSAAHIFGCSNGFDNFAMMFYAGRYSLLVGFIAAAVTMTVGVAWGIYAGFRGGKLDAVMMRFVDIFLSIPGLYLLILVITIFGDSFTSIVLVLGFAGWFGVSRLMRSEAQVVREREYVQASTTMGATRRGIMWRHILPNSASTMITTGTFAVGDSVLALSTISFLGYGLKPPQYDWGSLIQNAEEYFQVGYWWTLWPVAILFILFVLSTNYIGDALRDAFDVRLQRQ